MEKVKRNRHETKKLKDTINLLRNNLAIVLIITAIGFAIVIAYALTARDVYKATTSLKISKPQGNILESPIIPEIQEMGSDRFIVNEIEIMKSNSLRKKIAKAVYDSLEQNDEHFSHMMNKDFQFSLYSKEQFLTVGTLAAMLKENVDIEQKFGLDIVEISVESPVPHGAALIANTYADQYKNLNLEQNRNQLTIVKNFLKGQREEKLNELKEAEEVLSAYQEKGGIIELDKQAASLISTIANFDAQKNAAQIELSASSKVLSQYKDELERQNPKMADYLESVSSEAYFKTLQEQIAKLEMNKDFAFASYKGNESNSVVKDYDQKIIGLKKKLNEKLDIVKAGIFASSPEEVKQLGQKILTEEIRNQSLRTSLNELSSIVYRYDAKFNKLPKTSIELARFQRSRESLEKLYLLVEEKYQEALINEQSQPGNVLIIDQAEIPNMPAAPNRAMIIIFGFFFSISASFLFVFARNYFDSSIKTPEDIENRNNEVLAWIPKFSNNGDVLQNEIIVSKEPDSLTAEAFRALRTRVLSSISQDGQSLKTVLISSPAPKEGKTTVSVNLASSIAFTNKKVLYIDCDLRRPRVHSIFKTDKFPGVVDYLHGLSNFDEIIKKSEIQNLHFITSGTIPPNPSEILSSEGMKDFLAMVRNYYDLIVIDSPPIIAVTDSEVITKLVDATILVVSSEKTEAEMLTKSVELIKKAGSKLIGVVLNNFSFKTGYGSYYKYYYYYSQAGIGKKVKKHNKS